jgi:hypothetical protein
MNVNKEEVSSNHQAGDFEHVYIKQEEQATPSSTFMVMKVKIRLRSIFSFCIDGFLHITRVMHT